MLSNFQYPARLQYWSNDHSIRERNLIEFNTLEDAIAFAMTQRPQNMEVAWIRTHDGTTIMPPRIATLWELREKYC